MSGFVFVALALTLAVLAAVLWPLVKRNQALPAAWPAAGTLLLLVVGGAAALYPTWSNWDWQQPAVAPDSPAAMVGRLARRLEKQPDDLQGWLLLGKSYAVIEQFPLSARAYQQADTLAKGQNAEALMGLGDALINAGRSDFGGRAGRAFEQALALDPNSVKALFYSAIAATERNDVAVAQERYARLLEGNPPPEVRRVIEEQIRALQGMATMAATAAPAPSATAAVTVPLRVTLSATVAAQAATGAPLFVLARVPGQRGPPLAAKRLDARFPQEIELASSDAMMAGNTFSAGQEIEVVARIANGGSAISRSGDPFGSVVLKAGGKTRVSIEINQLTP